jgi:hypothetical protein
MMGAISASYVTERFSQSPLCGSGNSSAAQAANNKGESNKREINRREKYIFLNCLSVKKRYKSPKIF